MIKSDDICNNYELIANNFTYLYKKLSKKLVNYGITHVSNQSFTKLIEEINNIYAVDHYYKKNTKPTDTSNLPIPGDTSYDDYNIELAKKTNFYMQLLRYYLALKGVPLTDINEAQTISERIDLIDSIDIVMIGVLTVLTEDEYNYGELIEAPYILTDNYGNDINSTDITITYGEDIDIPCTIADDKIFFYPYKLGENTYYFKFNGAPKYISSQMIRTFNVLPARTHLDISLINVTNGRYYNSNDTGYDTDQWHLVIESKGLRNKIKPNTPIKVLVNNVVMTTITTDENGKYDDYINFPNFGDNIVTIQTDYEDNNTSYDYNIKILHNLFCRQSERIVRYGAQTNYALTIQLCNELDGSAPYRDYDGQRVWFYLDGEYKGVEFVSNGKINYVIDELSIGLHNFDIKMVLETDAHFEEIADELYDNITYEITTTDDNGATITETTAPDGMPFIKTIIFDIRENLNVYNYIQIDNNGDLLLSTTSTVDILDNPSLLYTILGHAQFDSNKNLILETVPIADNIEDTIKEGITTISIDDNGIITYQTVNDIYSLDN